ncbi:hypothetical protein DLM78_00005, partial [Leptospira stimsonii]
RSAQSESRAAQERNNQQQGADAIAGAGVETQRREENILDHVLSSAGEALGNAWDGAKNALGFGPDKVVMMPAMGGISGNNEKITLGQMDIKVNKGQEGESFFRTPPKGLQGSETDKVYTNMHDPNQKIDKIDWDYSKDNKMHNSKQKGQADLYAKEGTPLSVMHSRDGNFELLKIENRGEIGGNSALVQFKDASGQLRQIRFNHIQDTFPSYVKEHFKARDAGPLLMQNGTVFGRVGVTGNAWVGNVIKGKGISGPDSHTHTVFYDTPGVQNTSTDVPEWLKPAIGFQGNIKNGGN